MKQIVKGSEPKSLTEHRSKGGTFDNLDKNELRSSLLNEQGYICCYCMCRIPEKDNTPGCKIEHYLCQSKNVELELDYKNLMASCMGNERFPEHIQTCDTFKGDKKLSFNPSSYTPNIEGKIKYTRDGQIYSEEEPLKSELDDVLNLNNQSLMKQREQIYSYYQNLIRKEGGLRKGEPLRKSFLEKEKNKLLTRNKDYKFSPYLMVGVYLLNRYLKKLVSI